jgi:hypothetical protein
MNGLDPTSPPRIVTLKTAVGDQHIRTDAVTSIGAGTLPPSGPLAIPRTVTIVSGIGFQVITDEDAAAVRAKIWGIPGARDN